MKDFVKRLETEKQELDERKMKLFNFMTSNDYDNLGDDEKFLLATQYNVMCIYSMVLFKRINLYLKLNRCENNGKK